MNFMPNFAVLAPRRAIFDASVCDFDWSSALAFVDRLASLPGGHTVVSFLNAHNANRMLEDDEYREILADHLILPDGAGMDIASKLLHGSVFPANLNGTDFVPALLTYMEPGKRVGLIGGRPGVLTRAAVNFKRHAPWHEFIPITDGYFDWENCDEVIERLEHLKPDILIVAMGTPMQEKWVHRFVRPEHARLVLTVGALFDFVAEEVPRAPLLLRKLRLEWLFRLSHEPSRLWRRYVVGIPLFMLRLMQYRLRKPAMASAAFAGPADQAADASAPDYAPEKKKVG